MSEVKQVPLSGVPETSLIPLYLKAMESQRPDALIKDEKAVELVSRMSYDFAQIRKIPLSEANKVTRILLSCEMDRYVRNFLRQHPEAVVVHIGCGLDSHFERVDNGLVEWYDLDMPDIIELRCKLIGDERERYHLLGCSVFDNAWVEAVRKHSLRPVLFLAEAVFVYFEGMQVKSLVLRLREHFPGAELVFDAWSPFHVWWSNLQISPSKFGGLLHWGIWRGQEIEGWSDDIRLLGEWGFFDRPEPRLAHIRWAHHIEALFRTMRIYHFQLGKATG